MPRLGSRLSGVNEVLRFLGHQPVSELGAGRNADLAESFIASAAADLQTQGWWFNRLKYTPTLTPLGWAHLPERYVLDEGMNDGRVEIRDGRRLYDRDNRTYVWGTDASALLNEDDLSAGAWTTTSLTVASVNSVPTVADGTADAQRLTQTAAGGRLEQSVAGLVDGTRYAAGCYVGVNESDTDSDTATALFQVRGSGNSRDAGVSFTFSRNTGRPLDVRAESRLVEDALLTEFIPVRDHVVAGSAEWFLAYFEYQYAAADVNALFQLYPVNGGTGSMIAWRPFLTTPGDFPLDLYVFEVLDYENCPQVVQRYLVRRAAVEMGSVLSLPTRTMQHLIRREEEAFGPVQRLEQAENRSSMLTRSATVARALGRTHTIPALNALRGRPRPGSDV